MASILPTKPIPPAFVPLDEPEQALLNRLNLNDASLPETLRRSMCVRFDRLWQRGKRPTTADMIKLWKEYEGSALSEYKYIFINDAGLTCPPRYSGEPAHSTAASQAEPTVATSTVTVRMLPWPMSSSHYPLAQMKQWFLNKKFLRDIEEDIAHPSLWIEMLQD